MTLILKHYRKFELKVHILYFLEYPLSNEEVLDSKFFSQFSDVFEEKSCWSFLKDARLPFFSNAPLMKVVKQRKFCPIGYPIFRYNRIFTNSTPEMQKMYQNHNTDNTHISYIKRIISIFVHVFYPWVWYPTSVTWLKTSV